jgi:hypothetical protein
MNSLEAIMVREKYFKYTPCVLGIFETNAEAKEPFYFINNLMADMVF